jgi:hypothetical protein
MRKFFVAAGLAGTLIALPVSSAVSAGATTSHAFKGKGAGTLTLTGKQFVINGTVKVADVGSVAFHSSGTANDSSVSYTTTFTGPHGETITTASTGAARHTRLGRVFITTDSVTGGTGRFADATGKGKTVAKTKFATASSTTGTVKFALAGRIRF